MSLTLLEKLDAREDVLLEKLRHETLLSRLQDVSDAGLRHVFNQRSHVALEFTPACDAIIRRLEDTEGREVLKEIVQEEYAHGNHREDFANELRAMGVSLAEIRHPPSRATREAQHALRRAVEMDVPGHYDIHALTFARVGLEALPGEEYNVYAHEAERRGWISRESSVFFKYHAEHDPKKIPLGQAGSSHADRIGHRLGELIKTPAQYQTALHAMNRAQRIRARFYAQFEG